MGIVREKIYENKKLKLLSKLGYPVEDDCKTYSRDNKTIIAVGDGVTRDPMRHLTFNCEKLDNLPAIAGAGWFAFNYIRKYGNIGKIVRDPATIAAQSFTNCFVDSLKGKGVDEDAVKEGFRISNDVIKIYNDKHFPNPEEYTFDDPASICASAAVIENDTIYTGFIGDCGVAIYNKEGELLSKTPNECSELAKDIPNYDKLDWKNPVDRGFIRGNYINNRNPEKSPQLGYLTGEKAAMDFVRTDSHRLNKGDIVSVYSDGLEEIMFKKNKKDFENLLKIRFYPEIDLLLQKGVASEGTLVLYVHD